VLVGTLNSSHSSAEGLWPVTGFASAYLLSQLSKGLRVLQRQADCADMGCRSMV
jgi:hypothetical protein